MLKVLYLVAVTAAVFAVPAFEATRSARWLVVPWVNASAGRDPDPVSC